MKILTITAHEAWIASIRTREALHDNGVSFNLKNYEPKLMIQHGKYFLFHASGEREYFDLVFIAQKAL